MFEKINIFVFIIAFAFGLFLVYISTPKPTVIVKYPTPENQDLIFEDDGKNCYKFNITEINCPSDKSKIESIPIERKIEDFRALNNNSINNNMVF